MKIEVNGYKNLEHVNLEIEDRKINMIFGISGSGKSSISYALQQFELEENRTIGYEDSQIVKINDTESLPQVSAFSRESVDSYIIIRDMEAIQSVLVEKEHEFRSAEKALKEQIVDLDNAIEDSREQYEFLSRLKNELGSNLTKDGELRKNSKIIGLENSYEKVRSKKIWNRIVDMPSGKLGWMKQGANYSETDICPYCDRRIPQKQMAIINKTNSFEQKTIDSVLNIQKSERNDFIGDNVFSKDGISQLKRDIIEAIQALDKYIEVESFLNILKEQDIEKYNNSVEPSEELNRFFPEVYINLVLVNERRERLERITKNLKDKTKKILSGRLGKINGYLKEMSMPFCIEAEYANGRIKNYKIVYIADEMQKDRPKALSEGEKCILAQLMFIFQCKHDNPQLIIIDDPASAFDDYRRNQILNVIKKELDGKTVLILSHDNIYAKYAMAERSKIGAVLFVENFGSEVKFREISEEDFGEFNDFVIQRIHNISDYYQKIINLRLLYEGSHRTIAYGYLSAIIHRAKREDVINNLRAKNVTEQRVIELIKQKFPELKDVDIPYYNDEFELDSSSYELIEKAFWIRENFKANSVLQELNDFAHVNRYLKICLNPYKFNYCTKNLYEYISQFDEEDVARCANH